MTNKIGKWYSALGIILMTGGTCLYLAEKEIITPSPLYGLATISLFSVWLFGYAATCHRIGVYDFFGPILTFTRHQKPRLFIIMIYLTYICAAALLLSSVRMILAV